jgi:hypothetical protein
MNKRRLIHAIFSLLISIFGYSSQAQESDQPWFDAAQKMAQAISPDEMRNILKSQLPGFLETIELDSTQNRDLISLWGLSRNIDESHLSDRTRTVPANVIQFLNAILKVNYDESFTFGHAGLTHTYGYLMSNLQTPFGFKRARYVDGEIESGFQLTKGLFSGIPPSGTLLSNLTCFAGQIAFRDHPEAQKYLYQRCKIAEINAFPFKQLKSKRLVERLRSDEIYLELRTDIVPFPYFSTKGKNSHLLIYSIDFHARGEPSQPRLITVFPVQKGFGDGIFSNIGFGDRQPIKLRYNASIPLNIPNEEMIGKRYVENENNIE